MIYSRSLNFVMLSISCGAVRCMLLLGGLTRDLNHGLSTLCRSRQLVGLCSQPFSLLSLGAGLIEQRRLADPRFCNGHPNEAATHALAHRYPDLLRLRFATLGCVFMGLRPSA